MYNNIRFEGGYDYGKKTISSNDNSKSLIPLKFIRLALDIKVKEMAELFKCTNLKINDIENGKIKVNDIDFLETGFSNMGIPAYKYFILSEFSKLLSEKEELTEIEKYRLMLIKALGIVKPELSEQCEQTLATCLGETSNFSFQKK